MPSQELGGELHQPTAIGQAILLTDEDTQAGFQQHLHFSVTSFAPGKASYL